MSSHHEAVVIEPPEAIRACVLWLHGLGADGHDFEPIVPELGPATRGVRFVFPHAPQRPVTINGGYVMRAWYDVLDMDLTLRPDEAGIRASEAILRDHVAAQVADGVAPERVVLAGFSQGGAIALHTGLRYEERLAGILALSTYLPLQATVATEASAANTHTSIFMAHGIADPVIGIAHAERSRDFLRARGYSVEWHSYPMMHAVCAEEIRAIGRWLAKVLG